MPAYDYAAVIAYDTARVRGRGSAIFLHVGTGTATAGCVSLPRVEAHSLAPQKMSPPRGALDSVTGRFDIQATLEDLLTPIMK